MDKLSWLLKKSGLVKKVTGLNYFKGDQPWAGQLQNSLPCLYGHMFLYLTVCVQADSDTVDVIVYGSEI